MNRKRNRVENLILRTERRINRHNPITPRLNVRQNMAAHIAKHSENGQVAMVYGGMDCDGARWDNRIERVPATVMHVERWANNYMDNAEGPQWWHIESPSEVHDLKPSMRDIALEAFENGHPFHLQA